MREKGRKKKRVVLNLLLHLFLEVVQVGLHDLVLNCIRPLLHEFISRDLIGIA